MARLLASWKQDLASYASQIPSRLETAFSKYVQWGQISPAESGYIRVVNVFFYFGSLSKIAKNAPGRNEIEPLRRLEKCRMKYKTPARFHTEAMNDHEYSGIRGRRSLGAIRKR
jgi:hypothetical protein